ncbi:MAG: hypothetical protein COB49_10060, partial [Alphaproteobacteria bacterium]
MNNSIHKIQAAQKKQRQRITFVFLTLILGSVLILAFLVMTKGIKLEIIPKDASDTAEINL